MRPTIKYCIKKPALRAVYKLTGRACSSSELPLSIPSTKPLEIWMVSRSRSSLGGEGADVAVPMLMQPAPRAAKRGATSSRARGDVFQGAVAAARVECRMDSLAVFETLVTAICKIVAHKTLVRGSRYAAVARARTNHFRALSDQVESSGRWWVTRLGRWISILRSARLQQVTGVDVALHHMHRRR